MANNILEQKGGAVVEVEAKKESASCIMAVLLKVQWVDQSNGVEPHRRIAHIGGISGALPWKHSQAQAIESIERGLFVYYVENDARAVRLGRAGPPPVKNF